MDLQHSESDQADIELPSIYTQADGDQRNLEVSSVGVKLYQLAACDEGDQESSSLGFNLSVSLPESTRGLSESTRYQIIDKKSSEDRW